MVVKVYISLTSGLKEVCGIIQISAEFMIRKKWEFPGWRKMLERLDISHNRELVRLPSFSLSVDGFENRHSKFINEFPKIS